MANTIFLLDNFDSFTYTSSTNFGRWAIRYRSTVTACLQPNCLR